MHRDYADVNAGTGSNTAVGLQLSYDSPQLGWLSAGLTGDLVGEIHRNGDAQINLNDDVQLLTEAWLRASLSEQWHLTAGRQAVNGEVLREDVFRHKSRAVEGLLLEFKDDQGLSFAAGHALRMSNWLQFREMSEFNPFDQVFKSDADSPGMTWAETSYAGLKDWQFTAFGCQVHEIAELYGVRTRWQMTTETAWSAFYRHEEANNRTTDVADAFGFAWQQKLGPVDMELGSFSVRGHKLLFDALTTGINHPLGSLMLICESPYDKDADTGYLRLNCPLGSTLLYALYAYTAHDTLPFNGHELNLVVNQQLTKEWSVAVKFGYGLRQPEAGNSKHFTDSRLVVNYQF